MTLGPRNHIIIIDGTKSQLETGYETNAGLLYKLLQETHNVKSQTLWYHPGIQGHGFWNWVTLASGMGINRTIRNAYAHLSNRYRPGDTIYLFGYSRGAYAVRSLAGMIKVLGLLRHEKAFERHVRRVFRMYEHQENIFSMQAFSQSYCHKEVKIKMIGVWDTVKALGLEYPLLWRLAPMATEFHNDQIGPPVEFAYQALALDETRTAYKPVLWNIDPDWRGRLKQVWFRGSHADVGGQIGSFTKARPLANIPLAWMLECAEKHGLTFPKSWQNRFDYDPSAPSCKDTRGIGKFFLFRARRQPGQYPNEYIHESVSPYEKADRFSIPVVKSSTYSPAN